jgi:hypothetical protein
MNSKLSPQGAIGLGWDRGLGNVWDVFVSRIRRCVCESLDTAIDDCASSADRAMKGDAAVVLSPTHQWVADNVLDGEQSRVLPRQVCEARHHGLHIKTSHAWQRRLDELDWEAV